MTLAPALLPACSNHMSGTSTLPLIAHALTQASWRSVNA